MSENHDPDDLLDVQREDRPGAVILRVRGEVDLAASRYWKPTCVRP
ncbi:hypothetical protein ACWDKQ_31945 [Saccharopolyspora sp. NPDC000995]